MGVKEKRSVAPPGPIDSGLTEEQGQLYFKFYPSEPLYRYPTGIMPGVSIASIAPPTPSTPSTSVLGVTQRPGRVTFA